MKRIPFHTKYAKKLVIPIVFRRTTYIYIEWQGGKRAKSIAPNLNT